MQVVDSGKASNEVMHSSGSMLVCLMSFRNSSELVIVIEVVLMRTERDIYCLPVVCINAIRVQGLLE